MSRKKAEPVRRNKPKVVDMRAHNRVVPAAPDHLSPELQDWWETYAGSDLAATFTEAHAPAFRRLFDLYALLGRIEAAIGHLDDVMSAGSTGQQKLHPLFDEARKTRDEILKLEDRFGLSPKAMAQLGLTVAQRTKTVADLVSEAVKGVDTDEDFRDVIDI